MLREYDVVALKHPTAAVSLPMGTRGTVLIVYAKPLQAYEVEFVDSSGNSLGTYTVQENDLRRVAED